MVRNLLCILSIVVLLAACGGSTTDNSIPPSFNSVLTTNDTSGAVVTRMRPDQPDADWLSFRDHEGLSRTDCYDLVVSPNAAQRFLAFTQQDKDGDWHVLVRAGLGNNVWGSIDAHVEIPMAPEFGCVQPYISHLKDDLYGILWVIDGTLYSALFAPNNPAGQELLLGDEEDGFFEGVSVNSISLAYYDDSLHVVWMRPERDRIMKMRGQVSDSELLLFSGATFTPLASTTHSKAIAGTDGLYIAAADGDAVKLYHTGGSGTDWAEVASCESQQQVFSTLLYVDQEGAMRTLLTGASITNERTISFSDCSTAVLQVPVGRGRRISYSAGT